MLLAETGERDAMQVTAPISRHTLHGSQLKIRRQKLLVTRRNQRVETCNAVKEIFMPALSSTMTEGKIVSWLKSEGDKITKGESVVVVESDKADMDVESCKRHAQLDLFALHWRANTMYGSVQNLSGSLGP